MYELKHAIEELWKTSVQTDIYLASKVNDLETKLEELKRVLELTTEKTWSIHRKPHEGSLVDRIKNERYEPVRVLTFKPEREDITLTKWDSEVRYFESIRKELLKEKEYRNKFVAIKDKEIIGVDTEKIKLAKRVKRQYPHEVILITRVQRGMRVVELPSPEIM